MWIHWFFVILIAVTVLFIARLTWVIHRINSHRLILKACDKRSQTASTMVVLGSGGHTSEILRLTTSLSSKYSPRHYIIANTDVMGLKKVKQHEQLHQNEYKVWEIPRSREVKQSWFTTVFSTIYAGLHSFPLVFGIMPDLVLCNGPGTCIPLCVVAFLITVCGLKKITIVYIESICRVETMSLSGKILYYFADHIFVQWPQLSQKYPKTLYRGILV